MRGGQRVQIKDGQHDRKCSHACLDCCKEWEAPVIMFKCPFCGSSHREVNIGGRLICSNRRLGDGLSLKIGASNECTGAEK